MSVSMIVITGRKGGGITVAFANPDWSETWSREYGSLEEAFQAIRGELKADMNECPHEKVHAPWCYTTAPPIYPWICRKCGAEGKDRGRQDGSHEYSRLKRQFSKDSGNG